MPKPRYVIHELIEASDGRPTQEIAIRNFAKAKRTLDRSARVEGSLLIVRSSDNERLSIKIDGEWIDFWADWSREFES